MDSFERLFRRQFVDGSRPRTRRVDFSRCEDRHRRYCRLHSFPLCPSPARPAWSHSRAWNLRGADVDPRSDRLRSSRMAGTNHLPGLHRKLTARFYFTVRLVKNETRLDRPALVQSPRNGTRLASILRSRSLAPTRGPLL